MVASPPRSCWDSQGTMDFLVEWWQFVSIFLESFFPLFFFGKFGEMMKSI